LLDRTLRAVGDTTKSWFRVYEIDTSRCQWLPVGYRRRHHGPMPGRKAHLNGLGAAARVQP